MDRGQRGHPSLRGANEVSNEAISVKIKMDKSKANKIYAILNETYPGATMALVQKNTLELMVATILSAQCTDVRVNIVTKDLFKKYRTVKDYADADQLEFEQDIRSTGFYKNKTKNIIASCKKIITEFNGKVPDSMDKLISLPGIARKTANIVLYHGYGKTEGIAVDTHVKRLSGRIGLTKNTDPVKIEQDLMGLYEKKNWGKLTNLLIEHGRAVCDARKPKCGECGLSELCEYV
jgi:endonuclease III